MSNFNTGNLLTAQDILNKRYAAPEMRMKPTPALALLLGNANFLTQDATTLRTRDDRAIEAHLYSRTSRVPATARAYNHTGTFDDSQKVTLSWLTKADPTKISLKLMDNSLFSFNETLANKLEQCMMNVLEAYETYAISYLQANKSTYSAALANSQISFDANSNFVVANSDKARFYQLIKSAMRQNKYGSQLDIIANSQTYVNAEYDAAQGAGNSSNLGFQFNGLNIAESIELTDSNLPNGAVIVMPKQTVCALDWIPKQNRMGWGDFNSSVGGYGVIKDPWGLGLNFALHGYAAAADTSATNGDTQDVVMQFEVSLDLSFNKAPLSGTNSGETVIFQGGIIA